METVAGERSRYSARILRVTGLLVSGIFFFLGDMMLSAWGGRMQHFYTAANRERNRNQAKIEKESFKCRVWDESQ
jgi:hypothetical protein